MNIFNSRIDKKRKHPRISALKLDGVRHLAIHLRGNIPIVPLYYAREREVVLRGGSIVPIYGKNQFCRVRKTQIPQMPDALSGLHALHWGHPLGSRYPSENY